ncbi:hypothetical protein ABK040_001253 [Willaertia magna]
MNNLLQQPRKLALFIVGSLSLIFLLRLLFQQHNQTVSNSNITNNARNIKKTNPPNEEYSILITGGAGFIGSHIVEYFLLNEPKCNKIVIVDNLYGKEGMTNKNLEYINKLNFDKDRLIFIKENILNRIKIREILNTYQIRYVFHLAALISVPESMKLVQKYIETNVIGTDIILEECRKSKIVKKVIFSSSAAIYGQDPTIPKIENMLPACESPYAQTKLDGEFLCKHHTQLALEERSNPNEESMTAIALRYFNVFGERQDPNSAYAAAIPRFIDKSCRKNEPIEIFGNGKQTRDFVYVKDVVWANVYAAFYIGEYGVFNVGYGTSITLNELADIVETKCHTGNTPKRKYLDKRPGDVMYSVASVRKLKSTGWEPKYQFKKALVDTVNYFVNDN